MNWGLLWKFLPFIFGVLVGSGLSGNQNVRSIILGYVGFMIVFGLLKKYVVKIKDSADKKQAIKEQAWETVQDLGEATIKGNEIGASMFDKFYKEYSFYLNVVLFASMIILSFYKLWLWALVCFLGINVFVVLNQSQRSLREIKEKLGEKK